MSVVNDGNVISGTKISICNLCNFLRFLLFTQKRFVDLEIGKLALSALHLTKAINRKKEIVYILSYLVAKSEIKAFAKT